MNQPATALMGTGQPRGVAPTMSLSDVVHRFKTMTTKRYVDGVKEQEWPPFSKRLWQRNFYEQIVRDEPMLNHIREYITHNPAQWALDDENPDNRYS
jgi:REP element-mobilizing transposase RayT